MPRIRRTSAGLPDVNTSDRSSKTSGLRFPDFRLDIVDLTAKDDVVVVRCRESGTHLGVQKLPVNGGLLMGVAPTHKHFEVEVMHWYIMRDGKIIDHYGARDDIGMMQQLGVLLPTKPFDWSQLKP